MKPKVYIGTIGMSVWFSEDLGETWVRPNSEHGLNNESRVWGLASHPSRPEFVLAATDRGLHRWVESQSRWHHVPSPMDGHHVWAIQQAPDDPDLLIAGISPGGLFASRDDGRSWQRLDVTIPATCMFNVTSRVTQILFDAIDPDLIWASVEIDAIWRSRNRGHHWERINQGLPSDDVHGIAVATGEGRRRLFAATNRGLFVSEDDGDRFEPAPVPAARPYFRAVSAAGSTLLVTNGDGPPGSWGRLYRSDDVGATWREVALPAETNSTLWTIAANPFDPMLIFVCSNLGEVYRSTDGATSFVKLKREMGEIRSSLWRPI